MIRLLLISVFFFPALAFCQGGNIVRAEINNGDTIPIITLGNFHIQAKRTWKNRAQYNKYKRLEKKVGKVYPFAHLAAEKLEFYAMQLEQVESEKEKKKFYKRKVNP